MSMTDNVAPEMAPLNVEIHPTQGGSILLHGWLRAYAEFEEAHRTEHPNFGEKHRTYYVRLELFEATDGQWVFTETVNEGNVMERFSRHCRVEVFPNKEACSPHFKSGRQHAPALMAKAGLAHVRVIGQREVTHG